MLDLYIVLLHNLFNLQTRLLCLPVMTNYYDNSPKNYSTCEEKTKIQPHFRFDGFTGQKYIIDITNMCISSGHHEDYLVRILATSIHQDDFILPPSSVKTCFITNSVLFLWKTMLMSLFRKCPAKFQYRFYSLNVYSLKLTTQ